jgi:SAM-dependent methyltransferase
MAKLRDLLPHDSILSILDLGSGTGRFVTSLQAEFQCPIIAVDPSEAMLEQCRNRGLNNVVWKYGSAENIPLDASSVDLAWMSQVFHHLESPLTALREVFRVLRPAGCLAIRTGTQESDSEIEWISCFPEAKQIDDSRLPSQADIVNLALAQGFDIVTVETVYQYFASSYSEYYDKISQRGLSSLISISDEAFTTGLAQLNQWVGQQPTDEPVYEPVDLFIFQATK